MKKGILIVWFILSMITTHSLQGQSTLKKMANAVDNKIQKLETKELLKTSDIPFWFNSSTLNYRGEKILDEIAESLNKESSAKFRKVYIKGLTLNEADAIGIEREDIVMKYLIKKGVAAERLQIINNGNDITDLTVKLQAEAVESNRREVVFILSNTLNLNKN